MVRTFVLLLALLASPIDSAAAEPAQGRYSFDIPASSAAVSLGRVASETGVAIGWPSDLPQTRLRAVQGKMTVEAALRRLLDGSGYEAQRVGPTAYRIVPIAKLVRQSKPKPKAKPPERARPPSSIALHDIIVTGQKQPQALQDAPMSIAIVDLENAQIGRVSPGTRAILDSVDGVAITNLGPGRNRQFIRGVADSPFNGPSQSTVAVQLDEARVTFNAPDPDIRLVDMERVEILKGPQGSLYGSGALGGIYHVITRKPDATGISGAVRIGSEAVEHGGIGGGGEAILNLPLNDDLALRGVGYVSREAGWIDNEGRNKNANVTKVTGARLALRWQPDTDWTLDVSGFLQDVTAEDSQYVTASDDTTRRTTMFAEPTDNDFKTASVTVKGKVGSLDLLGTSSYVRHKVDSVFDASPVSEDFGLKGPSRFTDERGFKILNHELRVSSSSKVRWLLGVSFLDARSQTTGVIADAAQSLVVERLDRKVREIAAFGEITIPVVEKLKVTAGARLFQSQAEDEAMRDARGRVDRLDKTIFSPSVAVSWTPVDRALVYLRYARAMRPGGLAPAEGSQLRRFDSDELGTVELGFRYHHPSSQLFFTASLFQTEWNYIQSDYLLSNGLTSTRNAGRGEIYGVEASLDWNPWEALSLRLGAAYVSANLVRDDTGEKLDDRRLPITPDLTLRARAQYRFDLADWNVATGVQVNYVGSARLSFDTDLDRKMGNYSTVGVSALFSRSRFSMGLRVDNLLDVKGDSFAFGNPFSIAQAQQYTPLRPRTLSLSLARGW